MNKKILLFFLILGIFFASSALAQCPVCTVAVGAGVGLCRYLGIDDTISGTWVGGLLVSLILATIDWLNKKNIRFLFRKILVVVFYYVVTIIPLYQFKIMGNPGNKIFGIDKLFFGIITGSIAFILSVILNDFLKKKNQGKAYFPFQKVVIPILFLVITSLIHWLSCVR